MSEQPNLSPESNKLPEKPKALDAKWYKRYEDIASLQAYEYFDDPLKERRDAEKAKFETNFAAGVHSNPTLAYPKMDIQVLKQDLVDLREQKRAAEEENDEKKVKEKDELIKEYEEKYIPSAERLPKREAELRKLKKEILASERSPVVKQAYRWRINEKIAELRLMQATQNSDAAQFELCTKFVYGEPSPDIFAFELDEMRTNAQSALNSDDEAMRTAAQRLLDVLPSTADIQRPKLTEEDRLARAREENEYIVRSLVPGQSEADAANRAEVKRLLELGVAPKTGKPELPKSPLVARVKEASERVLASLLSENSPTHADAEQIDAQTIYDMFTEALKTLKMLKTVENPDGWNVILDKSSKTGISVDQERKEVKIPKERAFAFEVLKGKLVHEIGVHVARRANGERSNLMMFGTGADRYEVGEEGVTMMLEKSLSKKGITKFEGQDLHFAISLARGLDGKKRDFHDVYEILLRHHQLKGLKAKDKPSEAGKTAWNQCVRVFRGTDAKTPGSAFTKDIIYLEGSIAVWEAIGKNPEELVRVIAGGKYDPSNMRHIAILFLLGITDNDLEQLKSTKS